jgi:hypothetical protein
VLDVSPRVDIASTKIWIVSPSVDMLPFGVTILATVPQWSDIPKGLINYPVGDFKATQLYIRHRMDRKITVNQVVI